LQNTVDTLLEFHDNAHRVMGSLRTEIKVVTNERNYYKTFYNDTLGEASLCRVLGPTKREDDDYSDRLLAKLRTGMRPRLAAKSVLAPVEEKVCSARRNRFMFGI
jgi:hypothetical protein